MTRLGKENVDVIIPVYHPDKKLYRLLELLSNQTVLPKKVYLLKTETGREEDTKEALQKNIQRFFSKKKKFGTVFPLAIEIVPIKKAEFDHGGTRHKGAMLSDSPFLLFMTQDAVPADEGLIEELLWSMEQGASVAYARQLAGLHAGVLETYTRLFNYPETSHVRTKADIETYGIKAFFCSNVCAMYRRDIYEELDGFPRKAIFNEDMIFASKVLQSGGSIAYCAEAKVYHSHSYTWSEQFRRNFDLGVSQADNPQVFKKVRSEKEGIRLVMDMIRFLWNQHYYMEIVDFVGETVFKYAGYLLGKQYRLLPKELVLKCTMNKSYWNQSRT